MQTRIGPVRRLIQPVFVLVVTFVWLLGGCAEPTPPEPQWNAMTNYVPPPRRPRRSAAGVGTYQTVSEVGRSGVAGEYTGSSPARRSFGNNPATSNVRPDPLSRRNVGDYPKRTSVGTYVGSSRVGRNPSRSDIGSHSNTSSKTRLTSPIK